MIMHSKLHIIMIDSSSIVSIQHVPLSKLQQLEQKRDDNKHTPQLK